MDNIPDPETGTKLEAPATPEPLNAEAEPSTPFAPPKDSPSTSPPTSPPHPDPPTRTLTSDNTTPTCRICRSESTATEPLFHPCKCSGSIKHVHEECLINWLAHSHKKHCELCKTPFRFTKLYDASMPAELPWEVFVKRALVHVGLAGKRLARGCLVLGIWCGVLPWLVRWAWRWMFYVGDVGWVRDVVVRKMRQEALQGMSANGGAGVSATGLPFAYNLVKDWRWGFDFGWQSSQTLAGNATATWPEPDQSIFSDWTYLSELTPNPTTNRVLLDIFEGQLITCIIIIGFILVFLIREWVVQQQPLIQNVEHMQLQVAEAAAQVGAQRMHIAEQLATIEEIQRETRDLQAAREELERTLTEAGEVDNGDLDRIRKLTERVERLARKTPRAFSERMLERPMDDATLKLRNGDEKAFTSAIISIVRQVAVSSKVQPELTQNFVDRIWKKIGAYSEEIRWHWEKAFTITIELYEPLPGLDIEALQELELGDVMDDGVGEGSVRRPAMPERIRSSRAMEVQRVLEETEAGVQRLAAEAGLGFASASDPGPDSSGVPNSEAAVIEAQPVDSAEATTRPVTPITDAPVADPLPPTSDADDNAPNPSISTRLGIARKTTTSAEELPITNAGPNAKVNIKRSGDGPIRAVPPPGEKPPKLMTKEEFGEMWSRLVDKETSEEEKAAKAQVEKGMAELSAEIEEEEEKKVEAEEAEIAQTENDYAAAGIVAEDAASETASAVPPPESPAAPIDTVEAPTTIVGTAILPPATPTNPDNFSNRVANVLKEEFGLDEAEELERRRIADLHAAAAAPPAQADSPPPEDPAPVPEPSRPQRRAFLTRIADYFWGDIVVPNTPDALPAAPEIRLNPGEAAPVVPAPEPAPADPAPEALDPEVLAAAEQAGLDADAMDDAEDIEGILELVGMQGPLVGLFQTAMFCLLLVISTILLAVVLPYLFGKTVLSVLDSPVYFLIALPLRFASHVADVTVDLAAMLGGGFTMALAAFMLRLHDWLSMAVSWLPSAQLAESLLRISSNAFKASGTRLLDLLAPETSEAQGVNGAILDASTFSHASLRTMQAETAAVKLAIGTAVFNTVDFLSHKPLNEILSKVIGSLARVPNLLAPARTFLTQTVLPQLTSLSAFRPKTWAIPLPSAPTTSDDPTLLYWTSTDRLLTILIGYIALSLLLSLYVASDTNFTSSPVLQAHERYLRSSLRQAGSVLKVILIITIEMLGFPLYCGILLDIAFLPLFADATLASRLTFAATNPYTFGFVHWFVGTCYMFHFALFVGMCRKILRKGVLWFIRDPDDPTFHPVRDVLERNVGTQLRKIAFSGLVYGALVILCVGGVVWGIGGLLPSVWPICWRSAEPILEFPADLLVYNFLTPVVIRLFRPSEGVASMYAWWLRRCARGLRLSHFLFGDRKEDEEGQGVDWPLRQVVLRTEQPTDEAPSDQINGTGTMEDQHAGKFVLTPSSDQYRPPKPGQAFLHTSPDGDVFIADSTGKRNEHFAAIYVPPLFRLRVSAFMVCLWAFSVLVGLASTVLPLVSGRAVLRTMGWSEGVNDIYAYSIGAYLLGGLGVVVLRGSTAARSLHSRARALDFAAWLAKVKSVAVKTAKCIYVYGFLSLAVPLLLATLLQLYLVIPLHTYATSTLASPSDAATPTTAMSGLDHTVHILQDYALGLLYVRLLTQSIFRSPGTRAAEAFRRITAPGYLAPDARLATRVIILPALLLTALLVLLPPISTWAGLLVVPTSQLSDEKRVLLYRASYPVCAALGGLVWMIWKLGGVTRRWRARIRDEVYLVGEKLHNFGEKKPPLGVGSVAVRRTA
ncbi:hypothetical protein B0A48_15759 [Cryoendolithus antarcticus]|uniref:RING-type E3 ubiquitin transferase n=1 Tax=Cryoendolithus antarcticus TaxID=1507870 RepID=A0A1V8SH76_9PEZI|nr:hypothetical protein B0A48_15759 [Cryoendolithus antarcticus]